MADTVNIPIVDTAWTEVSTAGAAGFLTNKGPQRILFTEAASLPAAESRVGHPLDATDFINYSVTGGQKVYCLSLLGSGSVDITPS